jgi:hypothetical protein
LSALGQLSFEGISVFPNGVTYYQDEKRPGSGNAGGSFFKFIPTTLWTGAPITDLNNSPLASGRVFGLRLGKRGNTDFGPGNNLGRGVWVEVPPNPDPITPINLGAAAVTLKLTAGYRPEDQDIDVKARDLGNVRICGTNTGEDSPPTATAGSNNFGETFCITDGTINDAAIPGTTVPEYKTLVAHYFDFGMPDNIAYQPGRGNWLIEEDGSGADYLDAPRNNDIWDCLDDGADKDQLADACVKIATLNDLTAETTGGVFNATGNNYYVSVQHNITGHGVVLKITGWK